MLRAHLRSKKLVRSLSISNCDCLAAQVLCEVASLVSLPVGALAMESLHRQVLPFLLRRLKEDVLKDLPPKIIQDYYCELSQLQVNLFVYKTI